LKSEDLDGYLWFAIGAWLTVLIYLLVCIIAAIPS